MFRSYVSNGLKSGRCVNYTRVCMWETAGGPAVTDTRDWVQWQPWDHKGRSGDGWRGEEEERRIGDLTDPRCLGGAVCVCVCVCLYGDTLSVDNVAWACMIFNMKGGVSTFYGSTAIDSPWTSHNAFPIKLPMASTPQRQLLHPFCYIHHQKAMMLTPVITLNCVKMGELPLN